MNISKETKIGWIGTGVMGNPMCSHLMKAGYSAYIYNRTKSKAANLLENGAAWCENPAQVAEQSDVIFSIVGFPQDVEEVMLGKEGAIRNIKQGSIIIEMTTSKPSQAIQIYDKMKEKGVSFLDAPVSGGDTGARNQSLAIMTGGDKETFQSVLPLLELLGSNVKYLGPAGSGQHTKMSNQILIASTMVGVVESLLYVYKAGLDPKQVMEVVGKGAAASWSYNNLGPRILDKNFDPGFFIKHFIKDLGIALEESKRLGLSLPGLALAHQFYLAASAMGWENDGTQGLYKVFAKLCGE